MLRAGVKFNQRVGRPPRRLDLRDPQRQEWEKQLGFALPSADAAAMRFGSCGRYLKKLGYNPHLVGNPQNAPIEAAALVHLEEVYPGVEIVKAEQNAWDALYTFDPAKGAEKIEVKGSVLTVRRDFPNQHYFTFNLHNRIHSKTIDRLVLVGLGIEPISSVLVPICRIEIPKSGLPRYDGKANLTIYATSVFGASHSVHKPYVRWRRPGLTAQSAIQYARNL
jgi:hypothetical protein